MNMTFQHVGTLSDEQQESIGSLLRDYNRAHNPLFFAAVDLPANAPNPLNIVVFDITGAIIGGLIAETQLDWLKVSIMAVAEHARGRGIGRRLVELAEQEAKARGCGHVYVDTMDYQAPDFYRKLDYQLAGTLENWDSHGHTKYLLTKRLT